jgi:uncharacterized protein YggU (UPF0235/DUF167 family)
VSHESRNRLRRRPSRPRARLGALTLSAELSVRLTPRSAREDLIARSDGTFAGRVVAPPVDGRANEALCRLVAKRAGVPPSRVAVVRGHKSREKVVRVEGLDEAELRRRLDGAGPGG